MGTSVDAVDGTFIALHPQTVQTADEPAAIWRGVRRGQGFPLRPRSGLLGILGSRAHLVLHSGLRRLIAEHTMDERIEEMPLEFHVVAVDVLTARSSAATVCPAGKTGASHDAEGT